jgi:carbon monoxide dehydrogenase subunit G
MKIAGEATLQAPVDKVWDALLDPAVLVRTIPGCEKLETTGENAYAMTVTAGVAAIKGTYAGTCRLTDLHPGESLVLSAQGAGAPGTIAADVLVRFGDNGDGTTQLTYDADAVVGGMIGGVGQRMLNSVSKRMAGEFFGNVDGVLNGSPAEAAAAGTVGVSQSATGAPVFTAPPRKAPTGSPDDLLKGVLLGAGLVLAGVVAGALAARRRP